MYTQVGCILVVEQIVMELKINKKTSTASVYDEL